MKSQMGEITSSHLLMGILFVEAQPTNIISRTAFVFFWKNRKGHPLFRP